MDLTVFKLEIDDITFNAPFGGHTRSDDASGHEPSGAGVKRIVGLGTVLVATVLGGVIVLKRRLRGNETEPERDPSPTTTTEETDERNGGAVGALIGLFFLMMLSVVIKKKRAMQTNAPAP